MAKSKAASQRQLRVGELIRHALAEIFARGSTNDPDLEASGVTVLEVQASPDLRVATVYVRPLLEDRSARMLTALERNRRHIRGLLSPMLKLKYMPDVRFKLDTALDHAGKIDALLKDPAVIRDLQRGTQNDT